MFEQVIQMKNYDLKSLLNCIDQYHIEGKLTDDERQELTQAARSLLQFGRRMGARLTEVMFFERNV